MKSIICVCLFLVTFVKTDVPLPPLPEDGSCQLGVSYQDGCNVCSCFGEKALLCKKTENCIEKPTEHILSNENNKESDIQQICNEGDFKNGPLGKCNVCVCSKGKNNLNEWSCDDSDCHINRRKRGAGTIPDLKSTPCAPNDFFRLDCNTCYCNSAKSGYRCSEHICDPVNSTEILIPQNITEPASLNVSSILAESTTASVSSTVSSISSTEPIPPTTSTTTTKVVENNYVADANITTVLQGAVSATKSVSNGTTENSVLSLG